MGLGDDLCQLARHGGNNCFGSTFGVSSGVYFIGRIGIRYYFAPKLALYADAGSGQGALHVGIMFKLSGQ